MARSVSMIGPTVFQTFRRGSCCLSMKRAQKPAHDVREAWESSIDWEIENDVRLP